MVFSCCFINNALLLVAETPATSEAITIEELTEMKAGTYPVIIEYNNEATGEVLERIVYMTVYYPQTITNLQYGEGLDAKDVLLNEMVTASYSTSELIEKAQARAWDLNTGTPIAITEVIVEQVANGTDASQYNVTFKTANGTTNTVNFLEVIGTPLLTAEEFYVSDSTFVQLQIRDWVYVGLFIFILLPVIIICISLLHTILLVQKTKGLLHKDYDEFV